MYPDIRFYAARIELQAEFLVVRSEDCRKHVKCNCSADWGAFILKQWRSRSHEPEEGGGRLDGGLQAIDREGMAQHRPGNKLHGTR